MILWLRSLFTVKNKKKNHYQHQHHRHHHSNSNSSFFASDRHRSSVLGTSRRYSSWAHCRNLPSAARLSRRPFRSQRVDVHFNTTLASATTEATTGAATRAGRVVTAPASPSLAISSFRTAAAAECRWRRPIPGGPAHAQRERGRGACCPGAPVSTIATMQWRVAWTQRAGGGANAISIVSGKEQSAVPCARLVTHCSRSCLRVRCASRWQADWPRATGLVLLGNASQALVQWREACT